MELPRRFNYIAIFWFISGQVRFDRAGQQRDETDSGGPWRVSSQPRRQREAAVSVDLIQRRTLG